MYLLLRGVPGWFSSRVNKHQQNGSREMVKPHGIKVMRDVRVSVKEIKHGINQNKSCCLSFHQNVHHIEY